MSHREFANILVDEVVDSDPPDSRLFMRKNGIDTSNFDNPDEIWKAFVRYNIDGGGEKSSIVYNHWNKIEESALIKSRKNYWTEFILLRIFIAIKISLSAAL